MWKVVAVLALSFTIAASVKTQCRKNTECGVGECCFYHEGPMVVSKRDILPLQFNPIMVQGGWCEKYRQQGESCSGIATMNGHCGCDPNKGLKCTWMKDPIATLATAILQPVNKRSMIAGGHSECRQIPI